MTGPGRVPAAEPATATPAPAGRSPAPTPSTDRRPALWTSLAPGPTRAVPRSRFDVIDASNIAVRERRKERDARAVRYQDLQIRLVGSEPLYRAYLDHQEKSEAAQGQDVNVDNAPAAGYIPPPQSALDAEAEARRVLDAALHARGFTDLREYERTLAAFTASFEESAVDVAVTALDRYESFLFRESRRYASQDVVDDLHDDLAPFRAAYGRFETRRAVHERTKQAQDEQSELGRIPGSGHLAPGPDVVARSELRAAQATAAREDAKASLGALTARYPILAEDGLPPERRISKERLARADPAALGELLRSHITERVSSVRRTRENIRSDHEVVYRMDLLVAEAKRQLEITPGTVFDLLVQERIRTVARDDAAVAALVGVLALAFAALTFGAGAVAVVGATGALVAGGVGAYEEFEKYRIASDAAGAGLSSSEPSPVWLVVAVLGVGLDAAGAVGAVRALAGAARVLDAGGELAGFRRAVALLERRGEIDARIARAAERAGEAAAEARSARAGLRTALGELSATAPSLPLGPFADGEVFRALVRLATARVRQGLTSVQQFVLELQALRVEAKLSRLTQQEIEIAARAFREGRTRAGWKLWEMTAENTAKEGYHRGFRTTLYKSRSDGRWWTRDIDRHGQSVWKVYREKPRGLEWIHDADEFGNFITDKHKGPTGLFLYWSDITIK